jgi:hypothetical protein
MSDSSLDGHGNKVAILYILVVGLIITPAILFYHFSAKGKVDLEKLKPEQRAVATIRKILNAEKIYHQHMERYGLLKDLVKKGLFDKKLGEGVGQNYYYSIHISEWTFFVTANPKKRGIKTHYFSNQTGRIYKSDSGPIMAEDKTAAPVGDDVKPIQ